MTRVRNIVIGLLLVAGLVYVGLKGYIYYQVKSGLDQAIQAAGPFAEIHYDGIGSSLRGSVTVEGVRVRAFGDEVQLQAVRVGTPNVLVLLSTISELQRGEAPEFLELELTGLEFGLNGPLMNFAQTAMQRSAPQLPASYPCAGQIAFGPATWRAMGYERLISDAFIRVDLDRAGRSMRLQTRWHTRDMGAARMAMEVAGIQPSFTQGAEPGKALLRWFELDYTDHSYYKRLVQYCTKRDKTSPTRFIASVVNADPTYYMYTWGVVPGEDLRRAVGEFLRAPQTISAVARPGTPLELELVEHYTPDDLIALLDLRVVVNGQGVASSKVAYRPELLGKYKAAPKPDLQWPPQPPPQTRSAPQAPTKPVPAPSRPQSRPEPRSDPQASPAPSARTKAPEPRPESATRDRDARQVEKTRKFGYRRVSQQGLDRHIGRYVRVVTADGAEREGVLSDVQATEVVVEHRMYGGTMAVPVPVSQIHRIEVWLPQDS